MEIEKLNRSQTMKVLGMEEWSKEDQKIGMALIEANRKIDATYRSNVEKWLLIKRKYQEEPEVEKVKRNGRW